MNEIDVETVTAVDQSGLALCLVAVRRYDVEIGAQSACFADAWSLALAAPGEIEAV